MAIKPPAGLQQGGQRLWKAVTDEHALAIWELEILEGACRTKDLVATLDGDIATSELKTKGSMDQEAASRSNPGAASLHRHQPTSKCMIHQMHNSTFHQMHKRKIHQMHNSTFHQMHNSTFHQTHRRRIHQMHNSTFHQMHKRRIHQ